MARMHRPLLFSSLRGYRRAWVGADLVAGLTLLAIAVPEQLATSRLAGMPPITGFYAFVAGTVVFALLGSNPQMSVGADSTIAPLFAAGVAHLALAGSAQYAQKVAILAVMVGILVALVSVLRLGWIAEFLSAPIITGFLCGVAVIIVAHQLPDFFGLPPTGGTDPHRVVYVATHLSQTNGWALGIGLGVLVLVVVCERIDRRIPGALVGMVISTALVAALDLEDHGVPVLGTVKTGAPHVGLPGVSWSTVQSLFPLAAVVALVVITQTAATSRAFADLGAYEVDAGRDFLAVGGGSMLAGLSGSFPVNASPPRTGAVANAGGRTQAGPLGAAVVLVFLIPLAGILKDVPLATLAAILLFVAVRLFDLHELSAIARFNLVEFALALITLLTVALIGVEQGIGVAVVLAILDRIRKSAQSQLAVLGQVAGTTSWIPLRADPSAAQQAGVLAVLLATPLWYANATHFRQQMADAVSQVPGTTRIVVLDAVGIGDVDFTGSRALGRVVDSCARHHIAFGIARASEHLRETFRRSGLLDRIGEDRFFSTVDEAVTGLAGGPEAAGS